MIKCDFKMINLLGFNVIYWRGRPWRLSGKAMAALLQAAPVMKQLLEATEKVEKPEDYLCEVRSVDEMLYTCYRIHVM